MNRGQMRRMLRRRVGDERDSRWSEDQHLDEELNAAAQYVAMEIGQYQRINYFAGRIPITIVAGQARYPIEYHNIDAPDVDHPVGAVGKVWFMIEQAMDTSTPPQPTGTATPCQQIDEREYPFKVNTSGYNDFGHRFFYIRRLELSVADFDDPDYGGTGLLQVGFPVVPPVNTVFQLYVSLLPVDIPTGAAADGRSFLVIPLRFHEMVVVRAALQLIGTDETQYGFLQSSWNDLYAKMIDDVGYMPDATLARRTARGDAKPAMLSPVRRANPNSFGGAGAEAG